MASSGCIRLKGTRMGMTSPLSVKPPLAMREAAMATVKPTSRCMGSQPGVEIRIVNDGVRNADRSTVLAAPGLHPDIAHIPFVLAVPELLL